MLKRYRAYLKKYLYEDEYFRFWEHIRSVGITGLLMLLLTGLIFSLTALVMSMIDPAQGWLVMMVGVICAFFTVITGGIIKMNQHFDKAQALDRRARDRQFEQQKA